jgi:hypothetical protein
MNEQARAAAEKLYDPEQPVEIDAEWFHIISGIGVIEQIVKDLEEAEGIQE